MIEVTVWGIKNLKKVEKTDPSTGAKTTEKRCTGTVEFQALAEEVGMYEDKKVLLILKDKYNGQDLKMFDIFERLDTIGSSILKIAQIVKEINEAKPNVGLSSSESV